MGKVVRWLLTFTREQERRLARTLAGFEEGPLRRRGREIGEAFIAGCRAALEESRAEPLAVRLAGTAPELRGFAWEGAGLGLALIDALRPGRPSRLAAAFRGPGAHQIYMLHVGAGWALARLPVSPARFLARLDPLCRWMAMDGFGFHQAFYRWQRTVERHEAPASVRGYALRPFDVGVGRRLWFTAGAGAGPISALVAAFPAGRQPDLWSGLGEACAYAGGRGEDAVRELRREAGPFAPQLAQGAAFSAEVRARAGDPAGHTEEACRLLCGQGAEAAAALAVETLDGLPADGELPAYELWRRRLQERFQGGA